MTPFTPVVFHILAALAGRNRQGYDISKEVLRQTDGQVRMAPGTLYGTLRRLLDQGWMETVEGQEWADERRRCYRLNGLGRRALEEEVQRMDSRVRTVQTEPVIPQTARA